MQLIKITRNHETGRHQLGRTITVLGVLTLTFGFYKEALTNGLIWQDYIAYAVAVTIIYTPSKAVEIINAIKGQVQTPPLEEKNDKG